MPRPPRPVAAQTIRARLSAVSPAMQGAAYMLMAAMAFVAMTSLVKYLGPGYPPALQNFYRHGAALLVMLPFIIRAPRTVLSTRKMPTLLFRALCSLGGVILQFYSYQHLPLAEANALSFTRPLWIVPLAAFVLHETVGVHRIAAVLIGFCGVLVMVHPWDGAHAFGLAQAAALAATLLLALSITGMKSLTRAHSPLSILAWSAVLGVALTLPPAVLQWRWPSPADLGLLAAMGAFGVLNQGLYIKAMSVGDAAALAPLDYSRLILSVAAGYLLFGEIPTRATLAGAAIIVVATLSITWREQRASRRAKADAAAEAAAESAV